MSRKHRNVYEGFKEKILSAGVPHERTVESHAGERKEKTKAPLMIRTTPVMWAIPMDEVMFSRFFTVFIQNSNFMPWDGIATTESTYLPSARNKLHKSFVEDSDLPYLMMVDSDVLLPPNTVERLIAHKLPVVGGWYKSKNNFDKNYPIVYDFVSESKTQTNWRHRDKPGEGLEKVDGIGAGCILMTRTVAEALGSEPYDMNKGGEDMTLCKKLLDLQIPLHVDWTLACPHIGVGYV